MGRPSKLTDRQWGELGRRLALGESVSSLSREFKVARSAITDRFSDRVEGIKAAANMLVEADRAVAALPVSDRVSAITLADHLKGISENAARAADTGMKTANILHSKALVLVQKMGAEPSVEDLRVSDAMLTVAGKASALGTQLMNANKGATEEQGSVAVYSGVPRG